MLSYEQALAAILEQATPLSHKRIRLESLLGFVLAEPLVARFEMPLFNNSAVDGYGVRLADTQHASERSPTELKLIGEIQAGSSGELSLAPGSAIKILTGGAVPASVEAVVMREFCQEKNAAVKVGYAPKQGENIRLKGEEFPQGQEVLPSGVRVTPPVVGLVATLGYSSFVVHEKPKVALVVTGDELVKPGQRLLAGQIYDSNSYALQAAITALGIEEWLCMHARDTRKSTRQAFAQALEQSDVVISAGGVSVGDHDYVKDVLEELGVETVFWRIAIKPGKPVYFGVVETAKRKRRKLVFGLPGNPVSALVTYHQFVKPALLKLMGMRQYSNQQVTATVTASLKKKPGRLDFVRAVVNCSPAGRVVVSPTRGQDSHMLSGLARANSLIHFAADAEVLPDGSQATVDMLNWWE